MSAADKKAYPAWKKHYGGKYNSYKSAPKAVQELTAIHMSVLEELIVDEFSGGGECKVIYDMTRPAARFNIKKGDRSICVKIECVSYENQFVPGGVFYVCLLRDDYEEIVKYFEAHDDVFGIIVEWLNGNEDV